MTLKKRIGLGLVALGVLFGGPEIAALVSAPIPGISGAITPAYAIVGRPLTPISVAGVARRTTRRTVRRRCAVGISYC